MLEIRPHHILCIRAYIGNGYSEEFNENIMNVIKDINAYNEKYNKDKVSDKKVKIVFKLDDICKKCPSNIDNSICETQEKVDIMDSKIRKYFNIKEDIYYYKDIEDLVYKNITEEIFDDICINCSWYSIIDCKKYIIK